MTNDDIKARVREVQLAATLDTMLTIRQKREYLAQVVRARVSELGDDSDLWQVTITDDGVTRKLPDKLRAIALDNELSGEGARENSEEVTVVVHIGASLACWQSSVVFGVAATFSFPRPNDRACCFWRASRTRSAAFGLDDFPPRIRISGIHPHASARASRAPSSKTKQKQE
jgi:hypothetical protein